MLYITFAQLRSKKVIPTSTPLYFGGERDGVNAIPSLGFSGTTAALYFSKRSILADFDQIDTRKLIAEQYLSAISLDRLKSLPKSDFLIGWEGFVRSPTSLLVLAATAAKIKVFDKLSVLTFDGDAQVPAIDLLPVAQRYWGI